MKQLSVAIHVNAHVSSGIIKEILNLKLKRIIFNPRSENPDIEDSLTKAGIEVVHGCTLVMLNSNTF